MSLSRAQLMEAAFRLGACSESLTCSEAEANRVEHRPTITSGPVPMTPTVWLSRERVENIRRTLKEVVDLLGKETK